MDELPSDVDLRLMTKGDVKSALRIVRDHDQDDYECAKETLKQDLVDQYVLARGPDILGLTGFRSIEGTDRSFWLSWTYLARDVRGSGLGSAMLRRLIDILAERNARKIFLTTSAVDEGPGSPGLYEQAMRAYAGVGFVEELRHADYFDRGETMIGMGLRIEADYEDQEPEPEADVRCAGLSDVDEIIETDDAYFIDWMYDDGAGSSLEDLEAMVDRVRKWKGRVVLAGVPSVAQTVADLFEAGGFNFDGLFEDFYEDQVHELRYRLDLV